jgi:2-keto-3-deoxy-L-arabinonate dehydratase
VHFSIAAGASGLVGPANASEFSTLSDDERRRWIEIVVAEAGGQVPVLASVTCGHALPAVALSAHAQRVGASGVMSMPPHVVHPDAEGCYGYYAALDAALDIPIMIQNYIGPIGTPMRAELLARMCRSLSHVNYIKEETTPSPRILSQTIAAAGSDCRGVFGGQAGQYLLDEYRRGAVGNMPACPTTDLLQSVWQKLKAGDEGGARALFNRILPLINFERLHGIALYKALLHRRGVIAFQTMRLPGQELDDQDRIELEAILRDIEPLYRL